MEEKELKQILEDHLKWINDEEGGKRANLTGADLTWANLPRANLTEANLTGADLTLANLTEAINLIKLMGVLPGNYYYKRFDNGLKNNEYKYFVGLNTLKSGETFAADERVTCSYPGFHFASKSWCAANYSNRPFEALIKIPTKDEYPEIQINEPWTTDGKASANAIIIVQIWDVSSGKDVTDRYKKEV